MDLDELTTGACEAEAAERRAPAGHSSSRPQRRRGQTGRRWSRRGGSVANRRASRRGGGEADNRASSLLASAVAAGRDLRAMERAREAAPARPLSSRLRRSAAAAKGAGLAFSF